MRLVIFDVDGTLTASTGVDDRCWSEAMRQVHGIEGIDTDWSGYPRCTDEGLAEDVFQRYRRRVPTDAEVAALRRRFLDLLERAIEADRHACRPVPGAGALLDQLRERPGWAAAIATGAWRRSATMKLHAAGIDIDALPAACAGDRHDGAVAVTRDEVIRLAMHRALRDREHAGAQVVYVGDGVWDARAARRLGLPFVGLRIDGRTEALEREGATHVLHDYTDMARVLDAIEHAGVPTGAAECGKP